MSVDATRWAWRQKVGAARKLVLLSLADRAGEDHTAWPSIKRLEDDTGLDRKTIMGAIVALEVAGVLVAEKRTGAVTVYRLIGVEDRHETSTKNGTGTENGTSTKNGTAPVPKTVLPPVPKTGHEPKRRTYQEPDGADSSRGTRLPADWKPPEDWLRWARQERPDLQVELVASMFADYWRAQPGQRGRKCDWLATWRFWVRNQKAASVRPGASVDAFAGGL